MFPFETNRLLGDGDIYILLFHLEVLTNFRVSFFPTLKVVWFGEMNAGCFCIGCICVCHSMFI